METTRPSVRVNQATHTGKVRTNNEDAFGWFSVPAGELILVADGVGGYSGGEVASKCAIRAFSDAMRRAVGDPAEALSQALVHADRCVRQLWETNPELRGCATTIVALLIGETSAWHIHAGDSRVYRFSEGSLRQLGRDHSVVQDMLSAGLITEEQARVSPRNVITQSLGGSLNPGYCRPEQVPYRRGDRFLLCTDGLWGMVEDSGIEALLRVSSDVRDNVSALLQAALEAGGRDNVTLQVVECLSGSETQSTARTEQPGRAAGQSRLPRLVLLLLLLFALAVAGGFAFAHFFSTTPEAPASQRKAPSSVKPEEKAGETGGQQQSKAAREQVLPAGKAEPSAGAADQPAEKTPENSSQGLEEQPRQPLPSVPDTLQQPQPATEDKPPLEQSQTAVPDGPQPSPVQPAPAEETQQTQAPSGDGQPPKARPAAAGSPPMPEARTKAPDREKGPVSSGTGGSEGMSTGKILCSVFAGILFFLGLGVFLTRISRRRRT